jgi:hypothetical protein
MSRSRIALSFDFRNSRQSCLRSSPALSDTAREYVVLRSFPQEERKARTQRLTNHSAITAAQTATIQCAVLPELDAADANAPPAKIAARRRKSAPRELRGCRWATARL